MLSKEVLWIGGLVAGVGAAGIAAYIYEKNKSAAALPTAPLSSIPQSIALQPGNMNAIVPAGANITLTLPPGASWNLNSNGNPQAIGVSNVNIPTSGSGNASFTYTPGTQAVPNQPAGTLGQLVLGYSDASGNGQNVYIYLSTQQ